MYICDAELTFSWKRSICESIDGTLQFVVFCESYISCKHSINQSINQSIHQYAPTYNVTTDAPLFVHNILKVFTYHILSFRYFEKAPSVSVNIISLVTSCGGLRKEEPQTAHPMSFTWSSHIAARVLTGR